MAITILTSAVADDLQDARNLVSRIEDAMDPRFSHLRGKLKTARELITDVENALADGCEL